jgi:hypothetical protein
VQTTPERVKLPELMIAIFKQTIIRATPGAVIHVNAIVTLIRDLIRLALNFINVSPQAE